jgi:hypothetical protein
MPLHRIYHPASAFSSADKAALAEQITGLYTFRGLPAFYVGGKSTDNFIRIVSQHLARQLPNDEAKKQFSERFENVLAPFIKAKGYDWEVNLLISLVSSNCIF